MDALFCHPLEFTKSALLPAIVQAALASLALELENPLTAVLHFVRDFLGYAVGHVPSSMESEVPVEMQNAIRAMIGAHGSTMCSLIMSGMIFTFPRDCVMDGAGALMTLVEMDPETSVNWIVDGLQMLPADNLSQEEQTRFISQVAEYILRHRQVLTDSAAAGKDHRRIQREIQNFVAMYRHRVTSPRRKSGGKEFIEGVSFGFHQKGETAVIIDRSLSDSSPFPAIVLNARVPYQFEGVSFRIHQKRERTVIIDRLLNNSSPFRAIILSARVPWQFE